MNKAQQGRLAAVAALVASLAGCAAAPSVTAERFASTGLGPGEQVSFVLDRYEQCYEGACRTSGLSEGVEREFERCLADGLQQGPNPVTVRSASEVRAVMLGNTRFQDAPRGAEAWLAVLEDAEVRRRLRSAKLRYLAVVSATTSVGPAKTDFAANQIAFAIGREWTRASTLSVEILDLWHVRHAGILTTHASGQAGYAIPVILVIPLPPVPFSSATESNACASLATATAKFLRTGPDPARRIAVDAVLSRKGSAYIALPADGRHGEATYTGSGVRAARSTANAFRPFVSAIAMAPRPQEIEEARRSAFAAGHVYLVYLEILHWGGGVSEWSSNPDRVALKISVLDARSGKVLDARTIEAQSTMGASLGNRPEHLLPGPLGDYAAALFRE